MAAASTSAASATTSDTKQSPAATSAAAAAPTGEEAAKAAAKAEADSETKAHACAYDAAFAKSLELTDGDYVLLKALESKVRDAVAKANLKGWYLGLFRGGSTAKGTAVHGAARDMDLVVQCKNGSDGFDPCDEQQFDAALRELENAVITHLKLKGEVYGVERKAKLVKFTFINPNAKPKPKTTDTASAAASNTGGGGGGGKSDGKSDDKSSDDKSEVSVDLLIGRELTEAERKDTTFLNAKDKRKTRRLMSASITPLQVQWVRGLSAEVKSAIRMAKWWRDCYQWTDKPVSYLIELLVAYAAAQLQSAKPLTAAANASAAAPVKPTERDVFIAFLKLVATPPPPTPPAQAPPAPPTVAGAKKELLPRVQPTLTVAFDTATTPKGENWPKALFPPIRPDSKESEALIMAASQCRTGGWVIVDAANPTNLVNAKCNAEARQLLAERATKTLNALSAVPKSASAVGK